MSNIEIGPINIDYLAPDKDMRSDATNRQIGKIFGCFFGRQALTLCRQGATDFSIKQSEKIDKNFFEANKEIFHLPDTVSSQDFYRNMRLAAIGIPQYFCKLVPELEDAFGPREEITNLSLRPSDLLGYLANPSTVHTVLAYEAYRHAICHFHLSAIEARTINAGLENLLFDIQKVLNKDLFEGVEGSGDPIILKSFHDDETNTVVGFPDRGDNRPWTAHLKQKQITVRTINGIGQVHQKPHKKEEGATMVKLWAKAQKNGGIVHIDEAIRDSIRMMLVLMDDTVPPAQLADLVVETLKKGIDRRLEANHPRKMPRVDVEKTVAKDKTETDRGQSDRLNLNARRMIWFEGVPTPCELTVYDKETWLNSIMEVGHRNPVTGLYDGRAHTQFDLRRAFEVIRLACPKERYPVDDYTINKAFVSRSKQRAFARLAMYQAG